MAAAGFDHDGGEGFDGNQFAVELEMTFAFQDEIDLGHFLVIVDARLFGNVDEVNARNRMVRKPECAARRSARPGSAGDFSS